MEQINITKASGVIVTIGSSNPLVNVVSCKQHMTLMGEDYVSLEVESSVELDVWMKDYITVFGRKYTMYNVPDCARVNSKLLNYTFRFEGYYKDVESTLFLNNDATGVYFSPDFSLNMNLSGFIDVIINNLVRKYGTGTWQKGTVPTTDYINLDFSNETCIDVLQRLMGEFKVEYEIVLSGSTKVINTALKIGTNLASTDTWKYGKGFGLKSISRQVSSSSELINRLFAFGSTQNITSNYRNYSQRLKLPVGTAGGEKSYLEDTTSQALYGVREGVVVFDEVYPRRTGTVSSLGADIYTFYDTSIDFNVNSYLIAGTAAKVHFNTGALAGYEFTLKSFDNTTKKFIINKITDDRGLEIPNANSAFKIAAGDTYVLVDITLPTSYITNAESELQGKAQTYLDEHKNQIVTYTAESDPLYLIQNTPVRSENTWYLPGDTISLIDASIINGTVNIRIAGIERNVLNKYEYTFTFSDSVFRKWVKRTNTDVKKIIAVMDNSKMFNPGRRMVEKSAITAMMNTQSNQ